MGWGRFGGGFFWVGGGLYVCVGVLTVAIRDELEMVRLLHHVHAVCFSENINEFFLILYFLDTHTQKYIFIIHSLSQHK